MKRSSPTFCCCLSSRLAMLMYLQTQTNTHTHTHTHTHTQQTQTHPHTHISSSVAVSGLTILLRICLPVSQPSIHPSMIRIHPYTYTIGAPMHHIYACNTHLSQAYRPLLIRLVLGRHLHQDNFNTHKRLLEHRRPQSQAARC